jgi:acyl carrier protein
MNTLERVIEIIQDVSISVPEDITISRDSELAADLGLDSLDQVLLISETETEFQIKVQKEEMVNIRTVGEMCDLIEQYRMKEGRK